MQEMKALAGKAIHGCVYPIAKPEYEREVTEASKQFPVLLHLASSQSHSNVESRLLSELFRQAARKFPEVKFCEMAASACIENYPERNCPTILVYKGGDLSKDLVRLGGEMHGAETRLPDFEAWLVQQGIVEAGDLRLRSTEGGLAESTNMAGADHGDDDDWD